MKAKFIDWWQQIRKHPIAAVLVVLLVISLVLIVLVIMGYVLGLEWTGVSGVSQVSKTIDQTSSPTKITETITSQPVRTLWDWMQLLIVPFVLAVGGILFNLSLSRTEQANTKQRYQNDQKIAADKQKDELLQVYLDRMSDLLLNHNLRTSKPGNKVRTIAQARTLTILPLLDTSHKSSIILFLHNAYLIHVHVEFGSIIDLSNADLSGVDLRGADLKSVNLSKTNLSKADLSGAFLTQADLRGANLSGANLSDALLYDAALSDIEMLASPIGNNRTINNPGQTNLSGADLQRAFLEEADLTKAILNRANLCGTKLRGAYLIEAKLIEANLSGASLINADLHGSDLTGANFTGADVSGANLLNTAQNDTNFSGVDLSTAFALQKPSDAIQQSKLSKQSPPGTAQDNVKADKQ